MISRKKGMRVSSKRVVPFVCKMTFISHGGASNAAVCTNIFLTIHAKTFNLVHQALASFFLGFAVTPRVNLQILDFLFDVFKQQFFSFVS